MKRAEAVDKIKRYFVANGATESQAASAFYGQSAMMGCLLLIEALGLVQFDDSKQPSSVPAPVEPDSFP